MTKRENTKKGFTILEVVLVLAVAGLIFLMVFVAFPALQRGQRDTLRKRNLALLVAAMNNRNGSHRTAVADGYSSRNNKTSGFCPFYKDYVGKEIEDPSTGQPFLIALYGSTKVINCYTGEEYDRGEFDKDVWVNTKSETDSWAKMNIGDVQYDTGAYCDGEAFKDNVINNLKVYAFRIKLENGGYYCVDNGGDSLKKKK